MAEREELQSTVNDLKHKITTLGGVLTMHQAIISQQQIRIHDLVKLLGIVPYRKDLT